MSFISKVIVYADGVNKEIQASATKTSNFTSTSSVRDASYFEFFTVVAEVTAVSGTTPTLDLIIQGSDNGSSWVDYDGVQLAQVNTTGFFESLFKGPAEHRYLRVKGVLGGTSPSFTLSIDVFAYGPNAPGHVA